MADPIEISTSLSAEELRKTDAYWRACNYLSAGMIYLRANPLLREPLKPEHIKRRLLGHWGSDPGPIFDLGASEPPYPEVRFECHVCLWARSRRSCNPCQLLSGRTLF